MKVTYATRFGSISIAYLDGDAEAATEGDTLRGQDKYSAEAVSVRLFGAAWIEVDPS